MDVLQTKSQDKLPIHLSSSQNRVFIKNGKIVNDDRSFYGDILIEDGIIKQIGLDIMPPGGTRTVDAKNLLVIPGGIDTHTHMQFKFMGTQSVDDFYSGTRAALAGGTTCIIDFVATNRGQSLLSCFDQYREWADAKVCCDYALHAIIPEYNERVEKEMKSLVEQKGCNSFKCFLAYPGAFMVEDDELFHVLKTCKDLGAITQVHAENGKLIEIKRKEVYECGVHGPEGHLYSRPEDSEIEATNRAITLADAAGCPLYVVHVMSAKAGDLIANSRREGKLVWGEPIAAGLATDGSHYMHRCWKHAAAHVMSPPLRCEPDNAQKLMKLLANGDLECTGTDHCVFNTDQKALGKDDFRSIPNGVNGVEDRMSVIWEKGVTTGILDPCKFVAVTSTNAAKVFNMYPRKGRIEVGSDADIVVWDPEATRKISVETHHQNVNFNIFEGMVCHGVPRYVLTNGKVVLDPENGLKVVQGSGKFIRTPPFSPHIYNKCAIRDKITQERVKPVPRDPYTGPVAEIKAQRDQNQVTKEDVNNSTNNSNVKTSIRTNQPPGGASTRPW